MATPLSICTFVEQLYLSPENSYLQQPLCEHLASLIVDVYGFADAEKSSL